MAETTGKVKGAHETAQAFENVAKNLAKDLPKELKLAAAVVAVDARERAMVYGARTAAGIKPGIRSGTALVRQSIPGRRIRPQFGSVLMRHSLLPAVEAKQTAVVRLIAGLIDRIGEEAGF